MVSWKDIIIIFRVRIPQLLLLEEQKSKMQIWLLIRPPSNSSPRQSRGRGPFEGNLFPLFAAVRMFSREPRSRRPNSTACRIASTSALGGAPASRRFFNLWKRTFSTALREFWSHSCSTESSAASAHSASSSSASARGIVAGIEAPVIRQSLRPLAQPIFSFFPQMHHPAMEWCFEACRK